MIKGKEFAEKLYSEIEEVQEERIYSTGNDELDNLLERAFCEGYEYAQKEFAEKKEEGKKKHTGAKVAGIAGGTAALGAGAIYGAEKLGEAVAKKGGKKIEESVSKKAMAAMERGRNKDFGKDYLAQAAKLEEKGNKLVKAGQKMQQPMKYVRNIAKKVAKR